jgi:pyruvate,water dikinase
MKLESIPIKDNPLFCIAAIQNYLRAGVPDPKEQEEHERGIRKKAEETLRNKLKNKRVLLIIPKLSIYRWVLRNTRQAIKNRENQRFARTEAYSLIRTLIKTIGKTWYGKGIIEKVQDIFYLEMEEIWSYIEGTSTCMNLKELINVRRKEFEAYELNTPDDHIETYGEVYSGNNFEKEAEVMQEGLLKGLGCCPGIVERKVQVVLEPDITLKLNGEIMVAKQTDPGWVVLFPSVSGLIIEKGSMLSHSAIVAREMGIPAVVGVKNATQILSSGDRVVLDGSEGTIKILQRGSK